MLFVSPVFLLFFLPVMLAVYTFTPRRFRRHMICIFSAAFYVLANLRRPSAILFLAVCAVFTYCAAHAVSVTSGTRRRITLAVSVCLLVASLAALRLTVALTGADETRYLPLGASIFLMASISCLVDIYRGDAEPPTRFSDILLPIAFFPALVAGPVIRYKDSVRVFAADNINYNSAGVAGGIGLFVLGFIKRVAVAAVLDDFTSRIVSLLADGDGASGAAGAPATAVGFPVAVVLTVLTLLQVYFAFSGYSDMARGLAMMLGIRLSPDFGSVLLAATPGEYIGSFMSSLGIWLNDYVFRPVCRDCDCKDGDGTSVGLYRSGRRVRLLRRFCACALFCICLAFFFRVSLTATVILLPMTLLVFAESVTPLRAHMNRNLPLRLLGRFLTSIVAAAFWLTLRADSVNDLWRCISGLTVRGELQSYNLYITVFNRELLYVGLLALICRLPQIAAYFASRRAKAPREGVRRAGMWCYSALLILVFVFTVLYILPQYPGLAVDPFPGMTL